MAAPAGGGVRDTPKLEYKLHRKLKVFNTSNFSQSSEYDYNLVTSSPKHGIVFVASTDGLLAVYRVADLLDSNEIDPSHLTVKLPEDPSRIAVNCDGELLAVVGREKLILVYNIKYLRNQDASVKLSVPRGSSHWVCDMQWSPSMSETLAIGFLDKITILHAGTGKTNVNTNNSDLGCLSWSPSGSSLVVGYADGTLIVYSPDLSLEKTIPAPAPPLFDGAPLWAGAVLWMSNNQYAVVYYKFLTEGRESAFTLINAPEGELPTRAEHVVRLESDSVLPRYKLLQIKPWNVMVCAALSSGTKLLPPDSVGDVSQPPVQLCDALRELLCEDGLYSLGVALDRAPVLRLPTQSHHHQSTDEMTVLHVLTQTGDLATYIVGERPSTPRADIESSSTAPCEPAALEPPFIYSNIPGRGASPTGGAPCDLPPLVFHSVHGENIMISRDGSVARRAQAPGGGVVFSARPVTVNEEVCIRLVEVSNRWHGVISFGFTTHDPATLSHALPETACPDLTNKPRIWAKALSESYCERDNVLNYCFTSSGSVHFGVNGEDKGLLFSGVDTRFPLWALVDVYGNSTEVELFDPLAPSQVRRPNQSPVREERLISGTQVLSVDGPPPQLRYQSPLIPLSLHGTKGRNVKFVKARGVAAKIKAEFCQSYVFTARPMRPGKTMVAQILSTETACAGSLAIGLTSCDPATLRPCDLPDDTEQLKDRPEYWVVQRDAASGLRSGDELAVTLTLDGEVRVSRNGSNPVTVMHVDHTVRLWAFVDITGATQKVRMLSSQTPLRQHRELAGSAQNINASGGTVLADSLPPQNAGHNAYQQMTPSAPPIEPIYANQLRSASENSSDEQLQIPNERERDEPSTSTSSHSEIGERQGQPTSTECIICCENPKDSLLYMCGHICMCYGCAIKQWTREGGGWCPLCRAEIKDVIRAYVA